jgi:chemotaxis protein methyltransferase CheR
MEALRTILAARAGLDPPAWALQARVRERAAALGLGDDDYLARALGDADELGRLIELLRVGETRFFRHAKQLEAFAARVLPSLRAPVNAWSAGCASGEEAWTLAMLLSERGLPFSLWATDLSTVALARAREGRYRAAAVERDVPAALAQRYFRRIGDDLALNDRLRPHVRFDAHNLLAAPGGREFDVIFCRNVLIYFDEARKAEAVERLKRALRPDGWLLVGYSEMLRDGDGLVAEGNAIYRKSTPPSEAVRQPPEPARQSSLAPSKRNERSFRVEGSAVAALTAPVPRITLRGDYIDGKRLATELRAVVGDVHALVDLDGATFLGDDAARVLRRAMEAAPHLEVRATRPAIRRWLGRHGIRMK